MRIGGGGGVTGGGWGGTGFMYECSSVSLYIRMCMCVYVLVYVCTYMCVFVYTYVCHPSKVHLGMFDDIEFGKL